MRKITKKIINAIRFWLYHTTSFWVQVNNADNTVLRDSFSMFDKCLSVEEIVSLYTAGIIKDDRDWRHIAIVVKRFCKRELYLDGKLIAGAAQMNGEAGKGDTPRPVDKRKYDKNYDRIFGEDKKCQSVKTVPGGNQSAKARTMMKNKVNAVAKRRQLR